MSLKSFHVVFITIAILLCSGVAWWAFSYTSLEGPAVTGIGVGASISAFALFVYNIYFIRKARQLV